MELDRERGRRVGSVISEGPSGKEEERQWKTALPRMSGAFVKHLQYVMDVSSPCCPHSHGTLLCCVGFQTQT